MTTRTFTVRVRAEDVVVVNDEESANDEPFVYDLGYDELGVKALLDVLGIPDGDGLVLSDRVGILAARYERCMANG